MVSGRISYRDPAGEERETQFMRAGTGPSVVLVHGVGLNAWIWQPQIEALTQSFDVIAYDTLGHGGSSRPPAEPTLADYRAQLNALLDALGVRRASLVGHSMGALVALEF